MRKFLTLCVLGLAAAAFAAESAVEIKTKQDVMGWGAQSYYQTPPVVTVADGTAKVECGKTVEGAKVGNYQLAVLSRRTFKAGTTYTFTFTLKSNKDVSNAYAIFQRNGKPYDWLAHVKVVLKADEPKTFKLTCTMKEDISVVTRTPALHIPLVEGQTVELSGVKIGEEVK